MFLTFFIFVFLYIIDIIVLVKCLDEEEKDLIYSYYSRFLYIKTIIIKNYDTRSA